jgi:DNA-directed RNA polymerase subunit RPC12/RpoP
MSDNKKNSNCLEGIECPHCGSQGPFRVPVRVVGDAIVSDDGIEDLSRSETEFLDDIDWRCLDCGKDFTPE